MVSSNSGKGGGNGDSLFDKKGFLDSIENEFDRGEIEYDLRNFEDDPEELREYLDSINGSQYMYVYGPYTEKDLSDVKDFAWPVWISPINPRLLGRKGIIRQVDNAAATDAEKDIFGEDETERAVMLPMHEQNNILMSLVGIDGHGYTDGTIDERLNRGFAVEQFIKNRSLGAKNSIGLSAGFAQAVLDMVPDVKTAKLGEKDSDEDGEPTLTRIRRRLDLISKYAARICGFSEKRLKEKYGSTRPITAEFFDECVNEAQSWTEAAVEQKNEDYLSDIFNISLWTEVVKQEVEDYTRNGSK